ncbi:MAG: DNA-3-methyladenine glycosylase 2 family protein [Euryarchaeota archaeon]|nr:DNA-3-methyladenine glycosylase 2 family protein [Euryarchaeota archaeon]
MSIVPEYWEVAKQYLRSIDVVIGKLIDEYEEPPLSSKDELFETLIHSIVGQQISAIAADAIWGRMGLLVDLKTPASYAGVNDQTLRDAGLSFRKIEYIRELVEAWPRLSLVDWNNMSDEEVRSKLISLRGIGPWTIDMVLIFNLLRPNIFPLGDVGVVRMIERLYANGESLDIEELNKIGNVWAPYRTVATWYLWRSLDPEPVQY